MIRGSSFFGILLLGILLSNCGQHSLSDVDPTYRQEIDSWHQKRIESLMAPESWLSLAGLFWLKEGPNSVGSAPDHPIVLPERAPDSLGTFWLAGDSVYMTAAPGLSVELEGSAVTAYTLTDTTASPPIARFDEMTWILIQRSNKYGIRLWDHLHPKLSDTIHIDRYPIDPAWRLRAEWIKDADGRTVSVRNVLDMEMDLETEGRLRFEYAGQSYELTALDGGEDEFFLIFADNTSGDQTYSGGRYLYADRPDHEGITYIDFNKAYNPPCAFTEFATCLLPPAENRLDLAITAGELNYGDH